MQGTLESKDTQKEAGVSTSATTCSSPPHPYMFCLSLPMLSTWLWSSEPPPYNPSPHLPFLTLVQLECSSTTLSSRSTSWKPSPCQTQFQSTMSMELQTRTAPCQSKLR